MRVLHQICCGRLAGHLQAGGIPSLWAPEIFSSEMWEAARSRRGCPKQRVLLEFNSFGIWLHLLWKRIESVSKLDQAFLVNWYFLYGVSFLVWNDRALSGSHKPTQKFYVSFPELHLVMLILCNCMTKRKPGNGHLSNLQTMLRFQQNCMFHVCPGVKCVYLWEYLCLTVYVCEFMSDSVCVYGSVHVCAHTHVC